MEKITYIKLAVILSSTTISISKNDLRYRKQSQDTKKSTVTTTETKTLADGTIVTVTREVTNVVTGQETKTSDSKSLKRESISQSASEAHSSSAVKAIDSKKSELSSRQIDVTDSSKSSHISETNRSANIHTSTFDRKVSNTHANSSEFQQAIGGSTETTVQNTVTDSTSKTGGHHRKSVITSSSADVSNAVLHRKSMTHSTEALHTISSAASAQRKSISNLCESGQYISNSSQSQDRRSLSALHRQGVSPGEVTYQQRTGHDLSNIISSSGQSSQQGAVRRSSAWSSSSIQQQQQQQQQHSRSERIVRKDNLSVGGGTFQGQSEAKAYGNFHSSTGKTEHVSHTVRRANASHIMLGDQSYSSSQTSSSYKKEFVPRVTGPCPATLLETKKPPFKHTRDTQKHSFYLPVVSN